MLEVGEVDGWKPTTIYEPILDRCVPEELSSLIAVLPLISVLSPNAEEALGLLSIPLPPNKTSIEEAASKFLEFGVGAENGGCVVIRSGEMGAFVKTRGKEGTWIDAFWNSDNGKIVDVTGAGNSFLGGLAAGLLLTQGDVYEAAFYASISASFTIEQEGLPVLTPISDVQLQEKWNEDSPQRRLGILKTRHRTQ